MTRQRALIGAAIVACFIIFCLGRWSVAPCPSCEACPSCPDCTLEMAAQNPEEPLCPVVEARWSQP